MNGKPDKRQKWELCVLSSIYPSLEDLTKGNKKKPIDIRLKLEPAKGSISNFEILVEVSLHVICPLSYPEDMGAFSHQKLLYHTRVVAADIIEQLQGGSSALDMIGRGYYSIVIPNILLENSKGLSPDNLQKLKKELLQVAEKKKGEESIFDLCQCVQEFLYYRNRELITEKEEEEEKKRMEKQENERRVRELNKQLSLRLNAQQPKSAESIEPPAESNSSEDIDGICSHDSSCTIPIGSRQIIRGKCLEHFGSNHSIHLGIEKENGKTYNVYEWKLANSNNNSEQTLRQIKAIEQEFNSGIKTLRHDNLVSYYNILSVRHEDHYIIQTLEEHLRGHNCNTLFIKFKINIGIHYIRYIARSVLEALDYLHSKNVVHRDIRSSYVYIEKDIVKVAGYATHRRLSDLVKNKPLVNYNKRKDIQKYGKFILELVSGEPMSDEEDMVVPVSLPLDLCDFLKMCKDEEQQYTTTQLLEHKFLSRDSFHFGLDDESDYPENKYSFEIQKKNLLRHPSTSLDHSRISSEFELVELLGKGAFGSVHKYRNILDERFYAIKKIQLNTRSKHTIKKIKNEVKLLSRLNHENVVRYYTSWIEEVEVDDRPSSCESVYSSEEEEKVKYIHKLEQLTLFDDVEKLAPPLSRNKVSTTYSHLQAQSSSFESESSDEDDDNNCSSNRSESDGIIFQESEGALNGNEDEVQDSKNFETKSTNLKKTYMYIQMEFCENSTLRSAIDNDSLCNDDTRVQRHFREILDGLDYIHKLGMIHRDLKPANIFLDLRKRVKIGDFGLATRNLKSKLIEDHTHKSELDSLRDMGESKTGNIGTFFYVAPEMNTSAKVAYNKKVDVYSLGIILFEMCYKPFPTGMERSSVLLELRKKDVNFPMDYESTLVKKYSAIIRWLLEHDVSKRPTVDDILQSELAPPPFLENIELLKMLNYTVSNPQTKVYKTLVANLFKQKMPLINDLAYDLEESGNTFNKSMDESYNLLKEIAVKVFTSHGAKNMSTPLFMPFTNNYTFQNNEMCVKLMTQGGDIVSVPCELRVHFARYVAWRSLFLIKRYSIERVFREQIVFGVSPKSFYECAFDIVTPTPGKHFLPDGEVIHAVYEILNELSVFNNGNVVIHLNHTLLLKAILTYFNIDEEYHSRIIEIIHEREAKLAKFNLSINLANLNLTSSQISSLIGIFFSKHEPGKIPPIIKTILNGKVPESRQYAEKALEELTKIMDIAKEMGVEYDICIVPGLIYNVQQFSGMICKFLYKNKKEKWETLAAGGRYDSMITYYRNLLRQTDFVKNISQSAVGVTIFFDKIVQAMPKRQDNTPGTKYTDVLVCLEDEWLPHRLVTVLRNLSTLQIEWMLFQTNSRKEADEYSETLKIPHIVMLLKNYNENKLVLKSWSQDRSKYSEKKCNIKELIEELNRVIKNNSPAGVPNLNRCESKSFVGKSNNESFSIVFHTPVSSKKRYENQINSKLDDIQERYHGPIVVLAFNIEMSIIKLLVAHLDFETEKSFHKSLKSLVERNSKQKTLQEICEFIYDYKSKPNKPFVILYSLTESSFKFI